MVSNKGRERLPLVCGPSTFGLIRRKVAIDGRFIESPSTLTPPRPNKNMVPSQPLIGGETLRSTAEPLCDRSHVVTNAVAEITPPLLSL